MSRKHAHSSTRSRKASPWLRLGRYFEGVCVNYRHPGPRRGEPRVGSGPDVAFPLDPVDWRQNSVRLIIAVKNKVFFTNLRENDHHFWGVEL